MESVEPQIGERVLVDLPRTRWDHRQGILREIRTEPGQPSQGFVYLDCMLVRFRLEQLQSIRIARVGEVEQQS
jgi:hypothetical protein